MTQSSLANILELEQLDINLFRSQHHCENFRKTLFGGQVLGQALKATYLTQDGMMPHSLHAYFLRPGSSEIPVIYDVENVRDGRSFSSRRAVAKQYGRPIFNMSASFHKQEQGFEHQIAFPANIPHPEDIIAQRNTHTKHEGFKRDDSGTPFEFVSVDESLFSKDIVQPPIGYFWIRAIETLADDPLAHHCALAFASDLGLLASALLPHNATIFDDNLTVASIDHAMWFHRHDFRTDEWLLCSTFSPWAGNACGFAQAHIFDTKKQLIASTTQEGLIRPNIREFTPT